MLVARPTRMMRNTWLFPLVIVLAGSIVKMAAYAILAPPTETLAHLARTLTAYGLLAMVVAFVHLVPQARRVLDHMKLSLPVLGQAERELAVNRFFHSFNLLYSTGGPGVEQMVKLAVQAVGNVVVADDLLRAAVVIEAGGTITDAFAAPSAIDDVQSRFLPSGRRRCDVLHRGNALLPGNDDKPVGCAQPPGSCDADVVLVDQVAHPHTKRPASAGLLIRSSDILHPHQTHPPRPLPMEAGWDFVVGGRLPPAKAGGRQGVG
ncbi:hypothetical protein ACFL5Q_06310 [Planctomycetota bacterium]